MVRSWQATGSATQAFQKYSRLLYALIIIISNNYYRKLSDLLKEEGSIKNVKTGALSSVKERKGTCTSVLIILIIIFFSVDLCLDDSIPNIAGRWSCHGNQYYIINPYLSRHTVKTCFVRPLSRGDQVPPDVQYPIDHTHSLTITGHIRCIVCLSKIIMPRPF